MVGSALARRLRTEDCDVVVASRDDIDLRRQDETEDWIATIRPYAVFVAAAKVGGILANHTRAAEFIRENLAIQTNVIHGAYRAGVRKLMFLGSSCVYPRMAPQPIPEDALLTGPLESTNQWYAVAKIAGIQMCQAYRRQYGCDFISVMPTNLYGPGDNFDLSTSHVVPALMRKIHEAAESGQGSVPVWGTGRPRREFLHVDDCADALVHVMQHYSDESPINIGAGRDITIAELAGIIAQVIGFSGRFAFDTTKPDGTPQKLLDVTRLHGLGWRSQISLNDGIRRTYAWFRERVANAPIASHA